MKFVRYMHKYSTEWYHKYDMKSKAGGVFVYSL